MKKISITGPESSGKTTLAIELSKQYSFTYVAEYSREFLLKGGKITNSKDLIALAKKQIESEMEVPNPSGIMLCDTDLAVLKIWNEEKFAPLHPALNALYLYHHYDYTLLCAPDVRWEPDPLRENPNDRDRLFDLYKKTLLLKKAKFDIITGQGTTRVEMAKELINTYLQIT